MSNLSKVQNCLKTVQKGPKTVEQYAIFQDAGQMSKLLKNFKRTWNTWLLIPDASQLTLMGANDWPPFVVGHLSRPLVHLKLVEVMSSFMLSWSDLVA